MSRSRDDVNYLFIFVSFVFFFFNDTATTEIYTLSLHDALPISATMRGSAVPTMVWSSAASSSASITPAVARTLMRVVSSPCGMGFSLLNAQRLDETQTQMTKLNQLGVLEPVGQGRLDPCGLTPERIHAVTALVRDLRVDGAPVRGIGDAPDQ